MTRVALIRCETYRFEEVLRSLRRGIDLLGGLDILFSPREPILLKPNLLVGDPPEKAVTTHPAVLDALSRLLMEEGFPLSYGDSPGFGSTARAAARSGIKEVFDRLNIPEADFSSVEYLSFDKGRILKRIPIARGAAAAGAIISVSKMKTHGFTRITGAVKNQFGCVPGLLKSEFHVKMPDILDFSMVLHDINGCLSPRLFIMDGISAMEGNGPRGGTPVPMNSLLLSTDPVALDTVFCKLIDLNPRFVPTLRKPDGRGLILDPDKIQILGDPLESLRNPSFDVIRRKYHRFPSKNRFPVFLKNLISPKPVIRYETCRNCGKCVLQCPTEPKSVNWTEKGDFGYPVYHYQSCIRCYCCQEICPHNSIFIRTPLLGRLIRR